MGHLLETLSRRWIYFQGNLFPWLEEELGPLTEVHRKVVMVMDVVMIERFVPPCGGWIGRPTSSRRAIARAFVAKATMNLPTTVMLLDRLHCDPVLRRICGWETRREIPDESTFSRAFGEFSKSHLLEEIHNALVKREPDDPLVGHISRDSTEIEAREKPMSKVIEPSESVPKRKRGRPKNGESVLTKLSRLEQQKNMTLPQMLDDLPKGCDVGVKRNSKGHQERWIGYKLHLDTADGGIPISCILTSASLHDSQAAIPLATMTEQRVTHLYELMDSAYDSKEIKEYSLLHGHVPIIDVNPRNNTQLRMDLALEEKARKTIRMEFTDDRRYNERSTAERVNGRLKDEFGGRMIRVRGHAKIMCHLMFGIVALTVDQLMRMVT